MYNLLIVDDEKIIRQGMVDLFSMEETLELNLFSAASAIEAQKILEQKKIDIVLTDIQMPKMNGLQLMDAILERWPHCKVVFLTGFSEFDYVYKAQKHARYVLKAEDDSKIIDAVREAVEEIENDFLIEKSLQESSRLKMLKRVQFLFDLMNGFIDNSCITQELFRDLEIKLDISEKINYVVVHHEYIVKEDYYEQLKITEDLQNLIERYFFINAAGVSFNFARNFIVILLQSENREFELKTINLYSAGELFQKACGKNFGMTVRIGISSEAVLLEDFLMNFQTVKSKFMRGSDDDILLIDNEFLSETRSDYGIEQQKNNIISRIKLMDFFFENSNKQQVKDLITEALELFENVSSIQDLFAVEVYYDIAVVLFQYINHYNLSDAIKQEADVASLFNVTLHSSWTEAFSYLLRIVDFLFETRSADQERHAGYLINKIKKYIQDNLSGDTSLDTLADFVNLSPEYISRLFKKNENINILQYINDLKIIRAKKLIADHNLQIKEIAIDLGFSSSGYFGRFFKSKTGLSPQAYREQL